MSDASLTEVRFWVRCLVVVCLIQVSFFARYLFPVSDTSLAEEKISY